MHATTIAVDLTPDTLQNADDARQTWAEIRRAFPLTKASATYLDAMRAQLRCMASQIDAELAWRDAQRG